MSDQRISEMEAVFLALADKTRLRLLNLMCEGEICVCLLVEIMNESQPKISRHLSYLRSAGIVESRRDGKWIHYKICEPKDEFISRILQETLVQLNLHEEMQGEVEKLKEICFSSNNTITISRAPKPITFTKTHMKRKINSELEIFLL